MNNLTASWRRGFLIAKAAKEHSNGSRLGENMGAALFSGSILVSCGFNLYEKSHPLSSKKYNRKFERSVHAELSAIIRRRYNEDKNLTMYVYREIYNKGVLQPAISKPCPNCIKLMKLAKIKRVRYYGQNGPEEMKL